MSESAQVENWIHARIHSNHPSVIPHVQAVLKALVDVPEASGPELRARLRISQPMLSRSVSMAGNAIAKRGRTRDARYARTRELPGIGSELPIFRVDERGVSSRAGTLVLLSHGRHWLISEDGSTGVFEELPPFLRDLTPSGHLGREFAERHAVLELPPRPSDWTVDQSLWALARRGEDLSGDLILGTESHDRWLATAVEEHDEHQYPALMHATHGTGALGGSSPKFLAYSAFRHVLVKYMGPDFGAVSRRWRDLLVCEALALQFLETVGAPAARARWFDEGGSRFLEVERFDRVGVRGRRGVVPLRAFAPSASWTEASSLLNAQDAKTLRWLDVFGQLIANDNRHPGNVSLFWSLGGTPTLAPAYDMVPMMLAPATTGLVDRPFTPAPPTSANLDVWPDAAQRASEYWALLANTVDLHDDLRRKAAECCVAVETLRGRY